MERKMDKTKSEHLIWEQGGDFDESTYRRILGEVREIARSTRRPFLLFGGLASAFYGRGRTTHDIDLLVKGKDADIFLEAFDS